MRHVTTAVRIRKCNTTHAHTNHTRALAHLHVWLDPFTCVTWLIHVCAMTHSHGWHDSPTCVTPLILCRSNASTIFSWQAIRWCRFISPFRCFRKTFFSFSSFSCSSFSLREAIFRCHVAALLLSNVCLFSRFLWNFFFLFPLIPLAILWCYVAFLRLSNHSPYVYLRVCVCVCVCVYIYTFRYI